LFEDDHRSCCVCMAHDSNPNSTDPFFDSTASILAFGTNAADDANSLVSWQREAFQHDPFAALARDTRRPVDGDADWTDASVHAPSPTGGSFDLSAVLPAGPVVQPVAPPIVPASQMPQMQQMAPQQMQRVQPLTVGRPPTMPATMRPAAPMPLVSQQIAAGMPIATAVPMPSMLSPEFAGTALGSSASQLSPVAQVLTPFALSGGSADPVRASTPRPSRRRARDLDPLVLAYHRGVKRERRTAAASRLAMYLIIGGVVAALYAGYMTFVH
jgi:hypothetical protein